MIDLRPHQVQCLEELREHVEAGRDPLLVAPCGFGKGTLVAFIVNAAVANGHQVVFTVRGKNLIADMSMRVRNLGVPHGVLMSGVRRERWHPVQVASIDTLIRMDHLPPASLLIADEADLCISPRYKQAVERFKDARLIGMTATPIRMSGEGLGKASGGLFDAMVLGPSEQQLISEGYLVGSRVLAPPPPSDIGKIKKTGGDLNVKEGAAICDKPKIIGDAISHWKKHGLGKKTVAFCWDQAHADHVAEQFRAAGVNFAYVDANTPIGDDRFPEPGTRAAIYRDLAQENGNLMGIASVGCLTTGWDSPIVQYLAILRKTLSFRLWRQILGRGSRTYPGKTHFVVADHVGNTLYHNPYGFFEDEVPWSLDGAAIKETDKEKLPTIVTCKQSVMDCWCGHKENHEENGVHWPCYATFKAGPDRCPYCFCPIVGGVRKIQTVDGNLEEMRRQPVQTVIAEARDLFAKPPAPREATAGTPTSRRAQLEFLLKKAEAEGKKPGWAKAVAEAKWGGIRVPPEWMPPAWRKENGF